MIGSDQIRAAEQQLLNLFEGWNSRYKYILLPAVVSKRAVIIPCLWSRRPVPHNPIPSATVRMEFAFRFSVEAHPKMLGLTFRVEEEELVHPVPLGRAPRVDDDIRHRDEALRNIDHHIRRHLKFKANFARNNPLPLTADQTEFFASRSAYEPLESILSGTTDSSATPAKTNNLHQHSSSSTATATATAGSTDMIAQATRMLESHLIGLFQDADADGNGYLDADEFSDLLLNSAFGFTKTDVELIMRSHDANQDGVIIYREFIPVAIDLYQTNRAIGEAHEKEGLLNEQANTNATARLRSCKDLHMVIDSYFSSLPLSATSSSSSSTKTSTTSSPIMVSALEFESFLKEQLNFKPKLSAREVKFVLANIKERLRKQHTSTSTSSFPTSSTDLIDISPFHLTYSDILVSSFTSAYLLKHSTPVELYLYSLFKKYDDATSQTGETTGYLSRHRIYTILKGAKKISLSPTQIHAILAQASKLHRTKKGLHNNHPAQTTQTDSEEHSSEGHSEGDDELLHYGSFARHCAYILYSLFSTNAVLQRDHLIFSSNILPVELITDEMRLVIETNILEKLMEFDADYDMRLNHAEFKEALSDTGLIMTQTDMTQHYWTLADKNKDNYVDVQEWKAFGQEVLLPLAREAALKDQMLKQNN